MKKVSIIKHNLMRAAMTLLVMLPWAANAQTRECNPITTYPWTENFDSYTGTTSGSTNNLPECWNYINTCTHNSYKGYPVVYGANYTSGHSGHNFLYFESYSLSQYAQYDPQPQYAILPEMSGLAGKHITLWAYGYLSNGGTCTFKIGTMSNPADANTFAQIAEQTLTNGWQEYMFTVPETSNTYLAIMIDAASGYNVQKKVGIDDIGVVDDFSQTGDNEYTIFSVAGWGLFCDAIEGGESFNGKTVKLGADITITRMAGSNDKPFSGTFEGQGHTLTLNYGSADNPIDAEFVAPFVYTTWSTSPIFRNLTIAGHIYSTYTCNNPDPHHPVHTGTGGLIGHLQSTVTIEHCMNNVEITVTGEQYAGGFVGLCERTVSFNDCVSSAVIHSAGGNNSGFVGWSRDSGWNINFTGCVFNGKLLQINGQGDSNGGFIGWTGASKTVTITNCLYAPAALVEGEAYASYNSATFARGWQEHCSETNSYYTTAFGAAQGKQAHSITAGNFVTAANAGTATAYATSGITSYGTGIKYNNVLYAGSGESVALTISNTVPASFNFTGYSVTDGASLNGSGNNYTLTMPNAEVDVVITANCTIPPVSYIDENGVAQTCTYYYPLEGTETTLGTAGQETWCVVQGTLNYSHGIQLLGNTHIILCDGAAMNIGTSDSPVSGSSFQEQVGFYGDENNLSLYAQSGNTGALTIYPQSRSFEVKDLTITGGNVNTTTISSNSSCIVCNNLTVCRSSLEIHAKNVAVQANDVALSNVTANIISSNSTGFSCSNFAVDNSQLTVTAFYQAIDASVITLGCTAATDFIKATCTSYLTLSYYGTVKIADGQTLYDGANAYTGTLTDAERQTIGGRKLTNVAPPTYDYIDLNGTGATHTAVVIDADNMPTALSGWYIVQGTVSYTNTIDLAGDTHIILADNAVMNVTVTGYNHGIQSTSGNNYSLFVYGQTGQSGELNVTSDRFACYIIYGGDITIAGGKVTTSGTMGIYAQYNNNGGNVTIKNATVTATGTSLYGILSENGGNITIDNSNVTATGNYGIYAQNGDITIASGTVTASGTQYGIFNSNGSVTINGGQVTATGNFGIYTIGSVTINGGQVSATGNTYGIFAQSGSITLGWTNPTDYIYANKYYADGNLSIADGKAFIDEDGQTYSGTIAKVNGAYPIGGKRLYPYIEGSVPYIDENGQRQLCIEYNVLNGTETSLGTSGQETWYVADGTLDYSQTITLSGNVHLILKDGAVMNVTSTEGHGINGSNHSISIYAQSMGDSKGQLHVNANVGSTCGIFAQNGNVNICGGEVEATAEYGITAFATTSNSNSGFITISNATVTATGENTGIYGENITINSGTVTANGRYGLYYNYNIYGNGLNINGGQVTANGSTYGIYANQGNITLGWTNASDFIYANSYLAYHGTLSIADDKAFIDEDGNNYNSGTVNASDINGKTLYPYIEGSVPYIDENGQRQLCTDYNVLTGTETTLGTSGQETWYVADGTLDYSHNITLNGDVHLILKDNAVMNVGTEETPVTNHGIYSEGHSISIYAQSMGESQGQLHVNAKLCGIFTRGGNVNICGGEVETAGDSEKYGEGIIAIAIPTYPNSGSITITNAAVTATGYTGIDAQGGGLIINSGRVIANSTVYGLLSYGNITINGGQVTAEGNTYGIFANGGGSITLGWTNPTDYIYASSYSAGGTLSIADGKTFIDEAGQTYSGTIAKESDGAYAINGKWLYPNTVSRFTKTIAAHHTEEGVNYGWYLIASPLSSGTNAEAVAHLVNSETPAHFDLYRFNQAAELEWENWKQQNSDHYHFNLEPGIGYLYANAADVNLVFAGTPYSGNGEVTITNVAGHPLSGWNLVGNPFSVDAYIGRDFYVLNESRSEVMPEASTGAIPPMEGVFVLAEQDEETVTFSTEALNKGRASKPEQVVLNLSRDRGLVIDRAIVRMGEGRTLPKFQLNRNSTKLYIPQDGTDYAIACAESTGEMPLNFKAEENGTYTLTISTTLNSQLSTLNYLHLIDNLTGADVDLLTPPACGHPLSEGEAQSGAELGSNSPATDSQTPAGFPLCIGGQGDSKSASYTFTAKTTDYESRFRLVFSICEDANGDNEAFAFISNGNIIVNGEGTLQVFDILGHQLITKQLSTLNSQLSTLNYKSGVYVLRLINGDTIRTQKIVIE